MRPLRNAIRHAAIVTAIFLLGVAAGCSRPADKAHAAPQPGATPSNAAPSSASRLGDLTPFRQIADDVAARVAGHDLAAAKARIKDLESSWDAAEAGIKPRAAADWHLLDDAIDHALSALRAGNPVPADCQTAMDDLLKTFDTLQGRR